MELQSCKWFLLLRTKKECDIFPTRLVQRSCQLRIVWYKVAIVINFTHERFQLLQIRKRTEQFNSLQARIVWINPLCADPLP